MLQVTDIDRRFSDLVAVDHVSLEVGDGELVGFVGSNGAGKTTTMRMIMGVLAADAGEVAWQGRPVTAADRRRFGYMPEERGLYPQQPVLSQLAYLGRLYGLSRSAAQEKAAGFLERFALTERAGDRLSSLSLGNQQRVQITAALMCDPRLLVLDEPFSGLDPGAVDAMAKLLRELTGAGVGILFSSHQLEIVERLCDRIVVMAHGSVAAAGSADELRRTHGEVLHRLVVSDCSAPLTWLSDVRGVEVRRRDEHSAVVRLEDEHTADRLLREALRHGEVRELAETVPSVAEIFREVAA